MNCRKRGKPMGSKQIKSPSRDGNPVQRTDGKKGMEYKPVKKTPGWDGSSAVVRSD